MGDHHEQQRLRIDGIRDGRAALTGPEHVVIDITNRCHNNCIACWTRSPYLTDSNLGPAESWHKHELDTATVLRLIDDLAALGTSIIRFTGGGEPFLHADLLQCIRAVKQHNIFCAVTTSLNTLKVEQVDELLASGVDELSVSLWASNGEEYVATHPNKSVRTFDRITEVLKRIKSKKKKTVFSLFKRGKVPGTPRINLLNVISTVNYAGVEKMYDYALEVGADSIYFAVVDVLEGSTDVLLLNDAQRQDVLNACDAIVRKNNSLPEKQRIHLDNFAGFQDRLKDELAKTGKYDEERVISIPCYIGWIFCRVMADGYVVPCCRGVEMPMGNLNEQSFRELWFSEKYNRFREYALHLKDHPEFASRIGCGKTCDNHMHNLDMDQLIRSDCN